MLVLGECGRVLAGVAAARAPARHRDPRRIAPATRRCSTSWPPASSARPTCPVSPPGDVVAGWSVDPARGLERGRGADAAERRRRPSAARCPSCPTRPAPTCSWAWRCTTASPSASRSRPGAQGVAVEAVERYDATRSLGHVTLDGAPATVLDAPEESLAARLAPRAGADRRRVARQRRDRARRVRRLRQGALHLRARDRLLPGRQALPHRGAAPARERPLAALLRRLGAPRRARRVPAGRERRALGRRHGRSTTPPAR